MSIPGRHPSIPGPPHWTVSSSSRAKWTSPRSRSPGTTGRQPALPAAPAPESGQASPRDNVVFEAGLFGGVLGMRRTFILHANGSKLPSDLLGLTCIRYGEATTPAEMRVVNQKLRQGDRERGPPRAHRRPVVAVLPDGAQPSRAFRREPPSNLARPRRRAGAARPLLAGGWQAVSEMVVRSVEGEEGAFGRLLLLEGGTASGFERTAAGRDGRDPAGIRRSRVRILHDSFGRARERERADGRRLLARRTRGHEHRGRKRRPATRGVDRRAAEAWKSITNA